MKQINKILTTAIAVLLLLGTYSCDEEFLEIAPKDQLSSSSIFATEEGADLFMNEMYMTLPDYEKVGRHKTGPSTHQNLNIWSHYYVTNFKWGRSFLYSNRAYEANTWIYWPNYPCYPFYYEPVVKYIRNCNLFIETVEENKDNFSDEWRTKRIAEARVIRAHLYHQLWKGYGGVPLITEVLNVTTMGDDVFKPSASINELYDFMVTELGESANDLPNEVGNTGHVTKGAALSLKAYIEFYMGGLADDPKPAEIGSLGNPDDYYTACAATCKQIMELGTYSLFSDYNDQFLAANNWNSESIWAHPKAAGTNFSTRTQQYGPYTSWMGGFSTYMPSQNLVDMYRMDNGLAIDDPASGYDPQDPYKNREERFYQSILYDGASWANHEFTLYGENGTEKLYKPGNVANTGYRRIKGTDPSMTATTGTTEVCNTPVFRYAEILLMYAEAKFRLGQVDATAIKALDDVRGRGGLPTIAATYGSTPSQSELLDIMWHERAVELCFEGYRSYDDLIRTRKADIYLNQTNKGIRKDADDKYEIFDVRTNVWPANGRAYYFPLHIAWLEQNPVWMDPANQVNGRTAGQNPGY